MRVMNMLLDVAGINLEANVTPGDREILKKLEAEAEDQERKQKQTTMEHVVFGRKVQLLGRAVICLALIFAVQIVKGAGSFWETLVAWSAAEVLWCGVREFYRGTDFALHELAVICGTLLLVLMNIVSFSATKSAAYLAISLRYSCTSSFIFLGAMVDTAPP